MPSSPNILRIQLTGFVSLAWSTVSESMLLGSPDLARSSRSLQREWNFLNHLITALRSSVFSPFAQPKFLVASWVLWPNSNFWIIISSQIRLHFMFFCAAFKSHTQWSNTQHVNAPTTTILPTTTSTNLSLNCFGHMIYAAKTSTYQDIVKLLTHWFDHTNKWYMHNPTSVLDNDTHKHLWDFDLQSDHLISARRPDLIIINQKKEENLQTFGLCCPRLP